MFSFPNSKQSSNQSNDSQDTSKSLRTNIFLVFVILIFGICGSLWALSDITGVYLLKAGNMSSPIRLVLMRKAANLEGDLHIHQGGNYSLVQSTREDNKIHLLFQPKEDNKMAQERGIEIVIDGELKDDKIIGQMTSSAGIQPVPVILERDAGTSMHAMIQNHMPRLPKF